MRKTCLIILFLFMTAAFGGAQTAKRRPEPRWESNLSIGYIGYLEQDQPPGGYIDNMNRKIAIVKSFWFYPFLPRILSLGLSFDYVTDDLPLSTNIALNLPTKLLVPFVCAGAGFSFSGSTLQNIGGGLKFRTGKRFGLVAEYRFYRIKKKSRGVAPGDETSVVVRKSNYFGAGIAYLY